MPERPDWYEVTQGSELLQGDLLRACPIPRVLGLEQWPLRAGQPREVDITQEDVVMVSQSCDLANDTIRDVVLAQVLDWQGACQTLLAPGNTFARSRQFRRALVAGNIPSLSLLHKRARADAGLVERGFSPVVCPPHTGGHGGRAGGRAPRAAPLALPRAPGARVGALLYAGGVAA